MLTKYSKVELSFELTYAVLVTTVKISILLFYRRVFPNKATSANFRRAWIIVFFLSVGLGIILFVAAISKCKPVSFIWNQHQHGSCLNMTSLLLSGAAINILTDVSILILPMPTVWHLQIAKLQKFAVSGVFLLGGLYVSFQKFEYLSLDNNC